MSRAAALSARIRSCSPGSGAGHGNTSSSWISPRNSDLVNDETSRSGLSSTSAWVAASIGGSLPAGCWTRTTPDQVLRPRHPGDVALALVQAHGFDRGGLGVLRAAGQPQYLCKVEQYVRMPADALAVRGEPDPLAGEALGLVDPSPSREQARRDARALDLPLAVGRRGLFVDRSRAARRRRRSAPARTPCAAGRRRRSTGTSPRRSRETPPRPHACRARRRRDCWPAARRSR